MKTLILNFERIDDMASFHSIIACALKLPDYYGANLDALNDCLESMSEPLCVIVIFGGGLPHAKQQLIARLMHAQEAQ